MTDTAIERPPPSTIARWAAWLTRSDMSIASMPADLKRVPSLDGLRALSIGLVLGAHLYDERVPGGLGVLIFFVISGFLITRLSIAEMKQTAQFSRSKFLVRRVFRLYPAVLLYVSCVTIIMLFVAPTRVNAWEPLSALFYGANYLYAWRETHHSANTMPFQRFWSLSIEEWYYAGFAFLFAWADRIPKRLFWLAAIACVIPLMLRFLYAFLWPELVAPQYHLIYFHTETRIDSIATGMMIAVACETERGRRYVGYLAHPAALIVSVALILYCLVGNRDDYFRETSRYTLENIAAAILLCNFVFSNWWRPGNWLLNWGPIVWIGVVSYSLYVWHAGMTSVAPWVIRHLGITVTRQMLAFLSLTMIFGAASLSYYGVEKPARKLRERLGFGH
jgi:peptidoglycan/LPS O-acetylase OafA/YrhL